jgi:hypothetical protein
VLYSCCRVGTVSQSVNDAAARCGSNSGFLSGQLLSGSLVPDCAEIATRRWQTRSIQTSLRSRLGRIAAPSDDDPAYPRMIVACIEGVPTTGQENLEPGVESHLVQDRRERQYGRDNRCNISLECSCSGKARPLSARSPGKRRSVPHGPRTESGRSWHAGIHLPYFNGGKG